MTEPYAVVNGKIGFVVDVPKGAKILATLSEAALVESYGHEALEEINRFGIYTIKKK